MINCIGQRFGRLINGLDKKSVRFIIIIFGAKNYNLGLQRKQFTKRVAASV